MDILLPKMQELLKDNITFARRKDICLVPNPGVIPEGAGFPYIGIKDGPVIFGHERMGGGERGLTVEVYVYDRLERSNDNTLALHQKARVVGDLLTGHCFDGDMDAPLPISQMPVALLYTKKGLVIRKGLQFKYEREE